MQAFFKRVRGKRGSDEEEQHELLDVEKGAANGNGKAANGDASEAAPKKKQRFWVEHKKQLWELAPFLWCAPGFVA